MCGKSIVADDVQRMTQSVAKRFLMLACWDNGIMLVSRGERTRASVGSLLEDCLSELEPITEAIGASE